MEYSILDTQCLGGPYYKLTLKIPPNDPIPSPGQFYTIRCSDGTSPLLRRPLSVHRISEGKDSFELEILYQAVGKGTQWLSGRKRGEGLDIIGPFGNGFILDPAVSESVIVAGGIGIAPLYALCDDLRTYNKDVNITIIWGVRNRTELFYETQCGEVGSLFIATDDGSHGFHGTANELLARMIKKNRVSVHAPVYACGPTAMLRGLGVMSETFDFACQVSLEEHMGCGFGACLSCAIPLKPESIQKNSRWPKQALQWSEDGNEVYSLVCKDGPVYDIREVNWDEWSK
ncbi:MAG: dihydroorotate dehydrogenase electron transfer subunit [Desulfatiglandaceae bacterium]